MEKVGKFVIIDLETMDFFKDSEGKLSLFETEVEALKNSWFYELENVHILEVKNHYDEDENDRAHEEYVKEQLKK